MFSFKQIEAYQPSLPASIEPEPKPRVPNFKSRHLSDQQWQTWGEEVHNYLSDEQTITTMIIWKSNLRCSGQEGHFTSKRKKKKRLCLNWLLKELSKTWLNGMVGGEREWERMDLTAYSFSKKIVMAQLQWDHRLQHNTRVNSRCDHWPEEAGCTWDLCSKLVCVCRTRGSAERAMVLKPEVKAAPNIVPLTNIWRESKPLLSRSFIFHIGTWLPPCLVHRKLDE